MIKPFLQDEAFLADLQLARNYPGDHFNLWWLGQSGFLVQSGYKQILLDPYLSDSLTKKYSATDKPHVRMTERVVAPEKLGFVEVVTSSHNHTDHLDAETLVPILKANPKLEIVIPEANRKFVSERLNIMADLPVGLDAGKVATVKDFRIHGVPAAHETIEKDELGQCKFLGYVVEFEGWTGQDDWNAFYRNIWTDNLPTKFLQHYQVMDWDLGESAKLTGGVSVRSVDGERRISMGDAVVLEGDTYLLPWGNAEAG